MARAGFLIHLPSMSTPVAERPADQTARTHSDRSDYRLMQSKFRWIID
jgi:hypothetical protein